MTLWRFCVSSAAFALAVVAGASAFGSADTVANGRLVFVSDRSGKRELYTMLRGDDAQVALGRTAYGDGGPAWSPDGLVAFARNGGRATEIYAVAPGGTPERLTFRGSREADPTWSPAGGRLIFTSRRDGNSELYLVALTRHGAINLTSSPGKDAQPSWAPEGTHIAFVSDRDGNHDIFVMPSNGDGYLNVTETPEQEFEPDWSPDGRRLVFTRRVGDGQADIYVMNADGSGVRRLTTDPADDVEPTWAPNGRLIAFASKRDGNFELYTIRPDGTHETRETSTRANERAPDWERVVPASSRAVYSRAKVVHIEERPCTIKGTSRNDRLNGTRRANTICGGFGNDTLRGRLGRDIIRGDEGDDIIYTRDGVPEPVLGGPGTDTAIVDALDDVFQVERVRRPAP